MTDEKTKPSHGNTAMIVIGVLVMLLQLSQFASSYVSHANGTDNQRQIEPTQIASLQAKLDIISAQSSKTSREIGELKTQVDFITGEISILSSRQTEEMRSIADVRARVLVLEKNNGK